MATEFNKLQCDVHAYLKPFKKKLEKVIATRVTSMERLRFRILYSQFEQNAFCMFIGINPGKGHKQKEIFFRFDDNSDNDFLEGTHPLAKDTLEVLKNVGLYDRVKESHIATNFYYLHTKGSKELKSYLSWLDTDTSHNFKENSKKWTDKLIRISMPKIIVCQGRSQEDTSVYDNVISLPVFNKSKPQEFGWKGEEECGYRVYNRSDVFNTAESKKDEKVIVVGYKRNLVGISDKAGLTKCLAKIKKNYF